MPYDVTGALQAGAQPADIAGFLAGQAHFDLAGARAAGASDQDIIGFLAPQVHAAAPDDDVQENPAAYGGQAPGAVSDFYKAVTPNAIQRGVAYGVTAAGRTATALGMPNVGAAITDAADPAMASSASSMSALGNDIRSGHYLRAASEVPSAVMEGAGMAAPALATAAAAPEGAAGAAAVIGAGALTGAATMGGDLANARAANNGRPGAPTWGDAALGVGGAAALGAIGTAGLGEAAPGIIGAAKQAGLHAAGDAAQAAGGQLIASTGTDAGTTMDPASIAAQAVVGAGTRAAGSAVGAVSDQVGPAAEARAAQARADAYAAMSPEDQAQLGQVADAGTALSAASANAAPGPVDPRTPAAARTAMDQKAATITALAGHLVTTNAITPADGKFITDTLADARNQQRVLQQPDLDQIAGMGLDPATTTAITDGISQTQMLSDAGVANRGTSLIGQAVGIGGKLAGYTVGGLGAIAGLHPVIMGEAGKAIGAAIGNRIGLSLGLNDPVLVKQAGNAAQMLNASGVALPDNAADLQAALSTQQDAVTQQQRILAQQQQADQASALNAQAAAAALRVQTRQQNFQRGLEVADANQMNAQRDRGMNLNEAAGGQVAMMALNRQNAAAQLQQHYSALIGGTMPTPTDITPPQQSQPAGSPVAPPGIPQTPPGQPAAPPQAPQAAPSGPPPAPSGTPAPPQVDPVAIAQARAAAANPQSPPPDQLQADLGASQGLPPAAQAMAQRLPQWKYGIGAALQDALTQAGTPKNVNMSSEVNQSLSDIDAQGWLPPGMTDQLKAHPGRVVPQLYDLIRNVTLMRHGIDRTNTTN